jgi:hypothetical protein
MLGQFATRVAGTLTAAQIAWEDRGNTRYYWPEVAFDYMVDGMSFHGNHYTVRSEDSLYKSSAKETLRGWGIYASRNSGAGACNLFVAPPQPERKWRASALDRIAVSNVSRLNLPLAELAALSPAAKRMLDQNRVA